MTATKVRTLIIVVLTWLCGGTNCFALGAEQAEEYQIKAAFLYKFAGYVEWPQETFSGPDSPLVFGIIGSREIAENLEGIVANRHVGGRSVLVRELMPGDSTDGVHLLFIGAGQNGARESMLLEATTKPVLIVTEAEKWFSMGGVINFHIVDNKVRFDIALWVADRNKLKISSRLLAVAHEVFTGS